MKLNDLKKLWVAADLAAERASLLWDPDLESAYARLRDAAGAAMVALGKRKSLQQLISTYTPTPL
jgi:hypothetical protein